MLRCPKDGLNIHQLSSMLNAEVAEISMLIEQLELENWIILTGSANTTHVRLRNNYLSNTDLNDYESDTNQDTGILLETLGMQTISGLQSSPGVHNPLNLFTLNSLSILVITPFFQGLLYGFGEGIGKIVVGGWIGLDAATSLVGYAGQTRKSGIFGRMYHALVRPANASKDCVD